MSHSGLKRSILNRFNEIILHLYSNQTRKNTLTLSTFAEHFLILYGKENFGYLLVRYNWSIPVSNDSANLLNIINGKTTIAQIAEAYGEYAIDFIGYLYHKNFIYF